MTRSRLVISESALATIIAHANAADPLEVGGLLVGGRLDRDVLVEHALDVRPTIQTRTRLSLGRCERDLTLDQFLRGMDEDKLGYVGTWHSHPAPAGISMTDRWALRAEAAQARDLVAMLVVSKRQPGVWDPSVLVGDRLRVGRAQIKVAA